jgi:enoyl-CoA hydratase/carnithine racemase
VTDPFSVEDRGPVRILTIDRPGAKNAIPRSGWRMLTGHLRDFEDSPARVLVVTGAGSDFCSGADLAVDVPDDPSAAENAAHMRNVGEAAVTLHRLTKPTIAAVDGVAIGAGMNLALGCDIVIATDRARFAEIFVRRGLTVDFGGSWLLPRLVGLARARELALTGRIVEAAEAHAIGLVTWVVAPRDLEGVVMRTAEALVAAAPLAQRFAKMALDRSPTLTFEQAIEMEDQAQAVLLASQDFREAVAAFAEKRPPEFRGT